MLIVPFFSGEKTSILKQKYLIYIALYTFQLKIYDARKISFIVSHFLCTEMIC
mgnify:CR=1 FL=1